MNRLRRIAIRFTPDDLQGRLALIITLAIAPICALALVLAIFQVRNAEEARLAAFEAQALDAIDEERAAMIKIKQGLRLAAAQAADELATTGGCDATIAAISKDHEWSTVSRIFNRDGVLSCGGNKVVDISERPEWKAFSADPIFTISDPFTGRFSGKDVILAYLPLPGAGRKHFAVVVGIDLAYITLLLGEDVAGMPVALLNRRGEVVTENRVAAAMSAAAERWLPAAPKSILGYGDRMHHVDDAQGVTRTFFTSELSEDQLWTVSAMPERSVSELWVSEEGFAVLLPLLICAVTIVAVSTATRRLVVKHMNRLRAVAHNIGLDGAAAGPDLRKAEAAGFGSPTSMPPPREIRMFESTLSEMSNRLADRNQELATGLDVQKRLLLEMHHRVKNNLQMISSLVNMEMRHISDPALKSSLERIRGKLFGLAVVHQNLFDVEKMDDVDLARLIADIVRNLSSSLGGNTLVSEPILLLDPLSAPTSLATPISLFTTEAVGNALKHGDPDDVKLWVSLISAEGGFELVIKNRIKPSANADADESYTSTGLGAKLNEGFARQIGGEVKQWRQADEFVVRLTGRVQKRELFAIRNAA